MKLRVRLRVTVSMCLQKHLLLACSCGRVCEAMVQCSLCVLCQAVVQCSLHAMCEPLHGARCVQRAKPCAALLLCSVLSLGAVVFMCNGQSHGAVLLVCSARSLGAVHTECYHASCVCVRLAVAKSAHALYCCPIICMLVGCKRGSLPFLIVWGTTYLRTLMGLTSAAESLDAAAAFSTVAITQQVPTLGD